MSLLAHLALLRCPPAWRLTRLVSQPADDEATQRHVRSCARCAREVQTLQQVVTLAGSLAAAPEMSDGTRRAIAGHLGARNLGEVSGSQVRPRRVRRGVLLAAAIPALGAAIVLLYTAAPPRGSFYRRWAQVTTPTAPQSLASIHAFGAVHFARVQAPPDEIVRLDEGTISLDVTPLGLNQRFRVVTADAVVEVRGTSFRVSAAGRSLLAASVSHGRVEVRTAGALAVLDAGDRWERDGGTTSPAPDVPPPAPTSPAPARTAAPTPSRRHTPAAATATAPARQPFELESALFDRGWASLRSGDAASAAALFARLEELARGRPIEEDALYWRAVAVARLRDPRAAARLFGQFLQRFARSPRADEAASARGWLLLETGDSDEAARAFQRASEDPSPAVRASAAEGLRRTRRD